MLLRANILKMVLAVRALEDLQELIVVDLDSRIQVANGTSFLDFQHHQPQVFEFRYTLNARFFDEWH